MGNSLKVRFVSMLAQVKQKVCVDAFFSSRVSSSDGLDYYYWRAHTGNAQGPVLCWGLNLGLNHAKHVLWLFEPSP